MEIEYDSKHETFSKEHVHIIRICTNNRYRNLGLKLMINYGDNDIEDFDKALESGADLIVLDYPVKYLTELSS